MRVTFLLPDLGVCGTVRTIGEIARRLARRGHDVTILAGHRWPRATTLLRTFRPWPGWIDLSAVSVRLARRFDPRQLPQGDVLVAASPKLTPILREAPDSAGARVYFIQEMCPETGLLPEETVLLERSVRFAAVGRWIAETVQSRYGQPCEFIPPAADTQLFHPRPQATAELRVGTLYHTRAVKGFPDALAAWDLIRKAVPEARLVTIGARHRRPKATPCEHHQDPPQLRLAEVYASCHVFLCASRYEAFGLVGLEAMAAGSALCTTDTLGSREYALDNETALVSPAGDPESLARNASWLLTDQKLRERLREAGRKKALECDWETSAARFEELLVDTARKKETALRKA